MQPRPERRRLHAHVPISACTPETPPAPGPPPYTPRKVQVVVSGHASVLPARRALIAELFSRIEEEAGIPPHSLEITLTETPRVHWGIRGHNGADLDPDYPVET